MAELTFKNVLKYSCNIGIIRAMKKMRKKYLHETLMKFGLGRRTNAGFPGESDGILRPVHKWSGVSKYSISIGHEVSVTSIQLAAAFGAIANGGVYISPSIIEAIENSDGEKISAYKPKIKGRLIREQIAGNLMKMMKNVVEKGTGFRAGSKYYEVVGKTGTAKKFSRRKGRYTSRVLSSFIGIAPYKNPEICVLVIIDDPGNMLSGGKIAAPVF